MEAVFFDGFILMHDQNVVQEFVDDGNAFGQGIGYALVVIDGVLPGQVDLHSLAGAVEGPFFVGFKEVGIDVGIIGAFDHVADPGEGLEKIGLAHDIGIDEGLSAASRFIGVERIGTEDAVDDVVIHALVLEDVL